ncbi:CHAT domain-containing protein [Flagelloscypha sp. PMI_526]|nr:CHAT domain-containing protein [Flagelloscypha sp. PMI_526]
MSESHQLIRSMEQDTEEITDEDALFLSELPVEEFDEQLKQLRERRRLGSLLDNLYSLTALVGAMDKPREAFGEVEEYLNDVIIWFGQEGTDAFERFQAKGQVADIETAIEKLGQAVQLTPDGHPDKPGGLNNLGISYIRRFQRLGEMADIDKAIECQVSAVHLTSDGHPNKPGHLSNLGSSHRTRFERRGEMADIDKAIECQVSAVHLTPDGHPDKSATLSNLGNSHRARFGRRGEMADIDKAIECQVSAVDLTPDGHPDKPMYLSNLGISHRTRFERRGEMADIDKAIECQVNAVDLTPDGHPDKPGRLNNLGNSHIRLFSRLGEMADIDKAIECQVSAVHLTPDGHPDKPGRLNDLGFSHRTRFQHLGGMADIDKAIKCQVSAVDLTPGGHPDKPMYLSNLGSSHRTRFERRGEMADIDKAIKCQVNAVDLTPDGHPDKPGRLNNLGNSHIRLFSRLGEMADIDKAIECQVSAVHLTPDGHPDKPGRLNDLGFSHRTRFQHLGGMADIDKAIKCQVSAVDLTPGGHPDKPMYLSNLGSSHRTRFERRGEMADIGKAIECQVSAVDLTPDGHPDKPMYLSNLGNSHRTWFERRGEMADIDKAVECQVSAVHLTSDGHPNKPATLNNLGISHRTRFERRGEMADIDKAIECQVSAVDLTPDGHPNKSVYLSNLGNSHRTRFERLGEMADIDEAIANFEQCATSIAGPPMVRFRAARKWISALRLKTLIFNTRTQGLRPQHTLINLIPELVWLGAPVHQRFETIQDVVGSSIHEAVSAAIRGQELELAVEWMEQGRSIVWSQLRRLRSPLDDLQDAHPAVAQKLQEVQRRIELSFLPRNLDNEIEPGTDFLEKQAQAHRRNIQQREDLLIEIRSKQGFESFLRPEKFSVLSKACQGRLVVLLTIAEEQCDALVISPSSSITHLSFTNMSQDVISELHARWENSRMARLSNRGSEFSAVLNLFDLTDERLPHITWCPAGPLSFLPFHAAGLYGSDSEERVCISDYAVSSYTPSLMALLSNATAMQSGRPSVLMVTQPSTPGQKALPGTKLEAKKIMEKAALNDIQSAISHLQQSEATVSAVSKELETHGWVHLACHGIQKFPDPMESSFALHDGSLTLASLMRKSMGHAQFAFLSACQTATGDQKIPDEAMHLTSGMLAAGFPSVVGTMWSIEDSVAPEVAETFYAMLFEECCKSAWKVKPEPAYALHFALQKLRKESTGDRDLMKWVPFVHYGL